MSGIAITFPTSPIEGQSYLAQNGFTYIYDSQKNRWKRGGEFVRAPKVLSYAGVAVTTTGSGITTGPTGALIYNVPGFVVPNSEVGVDSYKAYRATESYPNYTEIQVSISSAFSTIAYAATFTGTTHTIPATTLSGDTTYYLRARQFVGSSAASAGVGAISGYSQNIVSFATTSTFLDTPVIVSIASTTQFPVYQVGFANTTLPATVTYFGSGVGNLEKVEWRVTGPRNPDSTGDTALAEVGIGTFSSVTLANALVLAMPFSGATGVGITNDVNNAIRTASGASAGTTKTVTAVGNAGIATVGIATTSAHFYSSAAFFDGSNDYVEMSSSSDFSFGTDDFTFEFWYYHISGNDRGLFANNSGASVGINFLVGASGLFRVYNGTGGNNLFDLTASPSSNTWQHLTLVRKNGLLSLFVNGILQRTVDWTGVNAGNTATFSVGSAFGNARYAFGYIQDFKIYKGLAKYTENFTPPLPTYGTISYTTRTIGSVGVATTAFFESTGDIPTAEASSTAANALVLAMPMNRTFGFQDINVAVRGLTSGASAGTAKTVGLGTTSTANAPTHPVISSTESKWYDGAAYFDGGDYTSITSFSDIPAGNDTYTIECWIRPTAIGNYGIVGWGNLSVNQSTALRLDAGGYILHYWFGNDLATPVLSLVDGNWHHVAAQFDGTNRRIYYDGRLVASDTPTGHNAGTSNFTVGRTSTNEYWNGYLQDLKIYKGFAKYTANFTPPRPICGFTTDLAIQTGFTTTSATGALLSSVVGLGSTSTLAFSADQTYAGITSITSSSGITTLPDPYAQNLVLALPLANITGVGNSFTNDRNTQIRTASITGAGSEKTITNSGVTTVSVLSTIRKIYTNSSYFNSTGDYLRTSTSTDFNMGSGDYTIEFWFYNDANHSGNFGRKYLFDFRLSGTGNLLATTDNNTTFVYLMGGSSDLTATTGLTANAWYHCAMVRNGSQGRVYFNGILTHTTTDVASISNTSLSIGDYFGGGYGWSGYINDFKVYKGVAKYTTNFTPPPPMFGDYVRSTPNKVVFTPGSDYVLEARNTATGGIVTSTYSATRQWGTKPEGGIYDPYAGNLVLAIPGGAVGGATSTFDVTGQIRFETPTTTYVNAGIVTYSNSLGIGTYGNKSVTNTGPVSISSTITNYYSRSMQFNGSTQYLNLGSNSDFAFGTGDFTVEAWVYQTANNAYSPLFETAPHNLDTGILFITRAPAYGNTVSAYNGGSYISSYVLPLNTWTHLAYVRRSGVFIIYANGINVGTFSNAKNLSATGTAAVGHSPSYGYIFGGHINDFRIYKGIAKYTSNFTPPNQIYLT